LGDFILSKVSVCSFHCQSTCCWKIRVWFVCRKMFLAEIYMIPITVYTIFMKLESGWSLEILCFHAISLMKSVIKSSASNAITTQKTIFWPFYGITLVLSIWELMELYWLGRDAIYYIKIHVSIVFSFLFGLSILDICLQPFNKINKSNIIVGREKVLRL
jgi:hypothetical protein